MNAQLTRRSVLGDMLTAGVLISGCSTTAGLVTTGAKEVDGAIVDPSRRPGFPVILVAMPSSGPFQAVRRSLNQEIQKNFDLVTLIVNRETTAKDIGAAIRSSQPTCVILMDNPTVRLYRQFDQSRSDKEGSLPVIVVMASFLEEFRGELANATGIAYEVPGVTAFVNLRSVIKAPVNRIGVLHRSSFRRFISRQQALAAQEKLEIVAVDLGREPSNDQIVSALRSMKSKLRADALWVLNDNVLLGDSSFRSGVWTPELRALGIPVVVGTANLVSTEAAFGTFAVLPDHDGLGVQAAHLLFELSDDNWRAKERAVELPVSTTTVADVGQIRSLFGLRDDALQHIDKSLE